MAQVAHTDVRGGSRLAARTRWFALVVLMLATVGGAFAYWQYSTLYPTTDNAYVGGHIVRLAAEVAGPVARVYVQNNEVVKANDPLFDIEPAPYESALLEARAQFDRAAQAAGGEADALRTAANKLDDKRVAMVEARLAYQQAKEAQTPAAAASPALRDAEKAWQDSLNAFRVAQADFGKTQRADLKIGAATVQLRAAAAALDQAEHNRVRALVNAPASGWVSDFRLRPGTAVGVGMPLFAIIEATKWWVDANFKETDIARIREGQPASIHLDMYPGLTLDGRVESISAGSGAVFSVLPPENATGNWVKVTQRFTVRVGVPNPPRDSDKPLRAGASAAVTVDTTQAAQ